MDSSLFLATLTKPLPPITMILLPLLAARYYRNYRHGTDWATYCLAIEPSIYDFTPIIWDNDFYLFWINETSVPRLFLLLAALLVFSHAEKHFGSLAYGILLFFANYLTAYFVLIFEIFPCYGNEALGPALAAMAVLVQVENIRIFPEQIPRNLRRSTKPIQIANYIWPLLFLHCLTSSDKSVKQYYVGLAVGLAMTVSINREFRRSIWRFLQIRKKDFFLGILLFASLWILPFIYGVEGTLVSLSDRFAFDFVSRSTLRVLQFAPIYILLVPGRKRIICSLIGLLGIYLARARLLQVPHLGLMGLLAVLFFFW